MAVDTQDDRLRGSAIDSGYDRTQLLWGIDIDVTPKKITALLGPNGAGKTTLVRCLLGLTRVWSGQVFFGADDVTDWPSHERVKAGLGLVPAGRKLFLGLSVEQNLEMGGYLADDRDWVAERIEHVYGWFPRLQERRSNTVGALSGGEQQMCAIGRGLMAQPKLLVIDELSMGLAPLVTAELLDTLARIVEVESIGMLLIEQDVSLALDFADRAYVLEHGRVAMSGQCTELVGTDELRRIFIGAA